MARFHPETSKCHSEPFDKFRAGSAKKATLVILSAAKDLKILRRFTPQNDTQGANYLLDEDQGEDEQRSGPCKARN